MNVISGDSVLKVLPFHNILNQVRFEHQLIYLKNHYSLITNLCEYFLNKSYLPDSALLVTFDDGDKSFYENAFPVLKKYNIPAVIFINLIDSHKPSWLEFSLNKINGKKMQLPAALGKRSMIKKK